MKVITIGRSSNNDIKISDPYVSRHHCQIIKDNGQFRIVNIAAGNGTYVNGKKINGEVILSPTDVVKVGNTVVLWMPYFESERIPDKPNPAVVVERGHIIPSEININQNNRNENISANVYKKGDDFQVPFKRNLGDKMGNAIGGTLGCIVSAFIIIAVLAIIWAILG